MRKPHHPAFAPSPTLVPLQAAIRSSCVHGGLDSVDLDQALADTLGGHIRLGADTDMMARERRNSLVATFWWRRSTLCSLLRNLPDARVGGGNDRTL